MRLQIMLKKNCSIIFILFLFTTSTIFFVPHDKIKKITEVISPTNICLVNDTFSFNDIETFDATFSIYNKNIAKELNITEEEAFILGNLGKQWASNLIKGRNVIIKNNDLIFFKYSYRTKFMYSGFCLINKKPYSKDAFEKRISDIRRSNYKILNLDSMEIIDIHKDNAKNLEHFIVIKASHSPKKSDKNYFVQTKFSKGNIKIYFTDFTNKIKPDHNCSSSICKEILNNINNAQQTIDLAIYGYSSVPEIENALQKALKRGVKIRLVHDSDTKGNNIYPNTTKITNLIPQNQSDKTSEESNYIMHNKFYIFDDKILITGSANLSHTDMSGFNSNSAIVINSKDVAKIYKSEFEQMFLGKFHNKKSSTLKNKISISGTNLNIYFSPQDKSITNAIIPLIRNAKSYIYIPTFVLTEKRVTQELIKAKERGVEIKIIIDALNASIKHSKHNELRSGGISVKTENYAGKMHSKSMIIDDKFTIIGSMNFSYSGENKNDENIIIIEDKEIALLYKKFFLHQWDKIDNKWLKYNAKAEGKDSIGSCFDNIDNDYDGYTDEQDNACK